MKVPIRLRLVHKHTRKRWKLDKAYVILSEFGLVAGLQSDFYLYTKDIDDTEYDLEIAFGKQDGKWVYHSLPGIRTLLGISPPGGSDEEQED